MTDQLELHRNAYRIVMAAMPGSKHVSHEDVRSIDWEIPAVSMPVALQGCPTCGDPMAIKGLTKKCRDWHNVCQCGARYDEPKNPGCRRRKHPKPQEVQK